MLRLLHRHFQLLIHMAVCILHFFIKRNVFKLSLIDNALNWAIIFKLELTGVLDKIPYDFLLGNDGLIEIVFLSSFSYDSRAHRFRVSVILIFYVNWLLTKTIWTSVPHWDVRSRSAWLCSFLVFRGYLRLALSSYSLIFKLYRRILMLQRVLTCTIDSRKLLFLFEFAEFFFQYVEIFCHSSLVVFKILDH